MLTLRETKGYWIVTFNNRIFNFPLKHHQIYFTMHIFPHSAPRKGVRFQHFSVDSPQRPSWTGFFLSPITPLSPKLFASIDAPTWHMREGDALGRCSSAVKLFRPHYLNLTLGNKIEIRNINTRAWIYFGM